MRTWVIFLFIVVLPWGYGGTCLGGLVFLGQCQKLNVQLEEREEEEKMQSMRRGPTCLNVGGLQSETGKLLRGRVKLFSIEE